MGYNPIKKPKMTDMIMALKYPAIFNPMEKNVFFTRSLSTQRSPYDLSTFIGDKYGTLTLAELTA